MAFHIAILNQAPLSSIDHGGGKRRTVLNNNSPHYSVIHIVSAGPCAYLGWTRRLSHCVARRSKRLSCVGPKRVICLGSFLSCVVRRADGEGGRTFRPISGTTQLNVHI